MKFLPAEPSLNFPAVRYVSEQGKWEIGLFPVMFGVRVRMGPVNAPYCSIDYCAGADVEFQHKLMATVMVILAPVDESISPDAIERIFPGYNRKPINNDPCWTKLQALANSILVAS